MRVLIISSNLSSQFFSILPNGAVSLSAYLKQHGHEARVCHIESKRDIRRLRRTLTAFDPEIVGISITATEARHFPTFSAIVKSWNTDVPLLIGGIHATLAAEDILTTGMVDGVCRGEGEEALLEYIRKYESGEPVEDTRNFWFLRDGELIKNAPGRFIEDLDSLPYMDREAVNHQRTIYLSNMTTVTIIGRGCSYDCTFCANHILKGVGSGAWTRNRSVDNTLGDLEQLCGKYFFKYITFRDDNLTWNKNWVLDFCEKYPRQISRPFDCFSRCDTIDLEQMRALKQAGCRHIFLGLDSGNDHIRHKILRKKTSNDMLIEVSEQLNQLGIKVVISNIIGLPYETPEDFQDTIEVNRRIHKNQVVISSAYGAAPKLWVFNPWPGTTLYDLCLEKGWLREIPEKHRVYRETYLDMPDFTPKQINHLYSTFRYEVYKKNHPLFALLFLFYDSRITRFVAERIPGYLFSQILLSFAYLSGLLKPKNYKVNLPLRSRPSSLNAQAD